MANRDTRPAWATIFEKTCWDNGVTIYIASSLAVLLLGAWTVVSPGWKDAIQMVTGRSWSHKIRRVARELEEVHPTWVTQTGRFLTDILPRIDIALWFLAFAEGTWFTLSHWTSMAAKIDPCPPPGSSSWGKSKVPIDGRPYNHEWQVGVTFVTEEGTIAPFLYPFLYIPPYSTGTFSFAGHFSGLFWNAPLPVDIRIIDDLNQVHDFDSYNGEHYDDRFNGPMCQLTYDTGSEGRTVRAEVRMGGDRGPLVWWCDWGHMAQQVTRRT